MEFKLGAHESLDTASTDWVFGQDGDAVDLERSMIEFMTNNRGIGLAANQIGLTKNVFVMGSNNIAGFPEPYGIFNPKILSVSEEMIVDQEGCLSYPDLWLNVKRPKTIIAEYQDSRSNTHTVEMNGYVARCFQHEFDHLRGICFVDRVSPMKLQLAMKKMRKRQR
jgi:peptide deformylase